MQMKFPYKEHARDTQIVMHVEKIAQRNDQSRDSSSAVVNL